MRRRKSYLSEAVSLNKEDVKISFPVNTIYKMSKKTKAREQIINIAPRQYFFKNICPAPGNKSPLKRAAFTAGL